MLAIPGPKPCSVDKLLGKSFVAYPRRSLDEVSHHFHPSQIVPAKHGNNARSGLGGG